MYCKVLASAVKCESLQNSLPLTNYFSVQVLFYLFVGISGEKIEIDPVLKAKFSFKQKPVTYDTESIASCTLLDEKSSGICQTQILQKYDIHVCCFLFIPSHWFYRPQELNL